MTKDLRTLVAIGTKLAMPNMSMGETIDYINAMCDTQLFGTLYPDHLTREALEVYLSESMGGSWEDLEPDSTISIAWSDRVASMGSILAEAMHDLVYEAECRLTMNIPLETTFVPPNLVHIDLTQNDIDLIMGSL